MFGYYSQLLHVFELDLSGPAQTCYWLADEMNASSSIKKVLGGKDSGDENSVSDAKAVRWLGRECNICEFH